MTKIHKTSDYSQFYLYNSNRDVHINNLLASIMKKDMLSSHPILVTPREGQGFYVVDGQHRLECAKRLDKPIYYIVDENVREEDIPQLQIQRGWGLEDYLKFYRQTHPEYDFVNKICMTFGLKVHFVVTCLASNSEPFKLFRTGKFKLGKSQKVSESQMEVFNVIYLLCKDICKKEISMHGMRALWNVLVKLDFKMQKLESKINTYPDKVLKAFRFKSVSQIMTDLEILHTFNDKKRA